jgi:hypothetical protein
VSSFVHNKCLCGSPLPSCKWSLECLLFSEIGVTISMDLHFLQSLIYKINVVCKRKL